MKKKRERGMREDGVGKDMKKMGLLEGEKIGTGVRRTLVWVKGEKIEVGGRGEARVGGRRSDKGGEKTG